MRTQNYQSLSFQRQRIQFYLLLSSIDPWSSTFDCELLRPTKTTQHFGISIDKNTCFSSMVPGALIASSIQLTISCIFSGLISGGKTSSFGPSFMRANSRWFFSSGATRSFNVFSHTADLATPRQ